MMKSKDKIKIYKKLWYIKNREKILKKRKIYREQNKEKIKRWLERNKEKILITAREWRKNNKDKIREYQKRYYPKKYKEDIKFRLSHIVRTRINKVLNGTRKYFNTMLLIGCDRDYLMYHIQEQFTEGMSWDNYGDWHIDHIRPCASFDLSKLEEQRKCFHYTNLQPLWAEDNLRKRKK